MNFQAYASCNNSELAVPTKHDGEYNVKVLVHEPKVIGYDRFNRLVMIGYDWLFPLGITNHFSLTCAGYSVQGGMTV